MKFWIKREQQRVKDTEKFKVSKEMLDLQENVEGIYVCRGQIEGSHLVFIPPDLLLAEKLIFQAHKNVLHWGLVLTMTKVRFNYWISTYRKLTKSVVRKCYGFKRFNSLPYPEVKPDSLPNDRTEQAMPFQVIGTDFAGPIYYRTKTKKEQKAYILIFSCSVSRAVHLELIPNTTTTEFIKCLKRLVARREKPTTIYSDNAKPFQAAAKWLKQIIKSEQFHEHLTKENINWKFNLPKAPWWGGHFERLIGVIKQALYKFLGRTSLQWSELKEVLLDVEINMNNRPLTYIEVDIQRPNLTPNCMILGRDTKMVDGNMIEDEEEDLSWRKRQKYVKKCKDVEDGNWNM